MAQSMIRRAALVTRPLPTAEGSSQQPASAVPAPTSIVFEEDPTDQLAVQPDAVDPSGVRGGLVCIRLQIGPARRQICDEVRQRDVLPDELPPPVQVGQELLGLPRFERAQLRIVA
jgi:hypothetical protein